LLIRIREQIENLIRNEDDAAKKKKGEERISLINKIIAGKEGVSLTVKDRTGNSAIISPKAKKRKI